MSRRPKAYIRLKWVVFGYICFDLRVFAADEEKFIFADYFVQNAAIFDNEKLANEVELKKSAIFVWKCVFIIFKF